MKQSRMVAVFVIVALSAACQPVITTSVPTSAGMVETQVAATISAIQTATSESEQAAQWTRTAYAPSQTNTPTSTVIIPQTKTSTPTATPKLATQTVAPPSPTRTATAIDCSVLPAGSFFTIWQSNPALKSSLRCPTSHHPRITPTTWEVKTAYQPFERGAMIWSDRIGWYTQPVVYVLYNNSTFARFEDRFDPEVDPVNSSETPPNGLVEPAYGFGKVWRSQSGVRESLGWATASETGGDGRFAMFESGDMIWISQTNRTYVFQQNAVSVFDIPFSP